MRDGLIWAASVAWLTSIGGAFFAWEQSESRPGAASVAAIVSEATLDQWRLVVFVHPHCPCSRAAVNELHELRIHAPELAVRVVFVRPDGVEAGWERGTLWDACHKLSDANVCVDSDGSEARRFDAKTSGQAVLLSPSGRDVFRGGLVMNRDPAGRTAVLRWLKTGNGPVTAPFSGCPLF